MPLFLGTTLQRKLAVGAVDDPLEREADQVAEQVMPSMDRSAGPLTTPFSSSRREGTPIRRKCACDGSSQKCAECRKREEEISGTATIQRKANGNGNGNGSGISHSADISEAPPIVHQALRSSGKPLDDSVRPLMESRFGRDFSGVRVHNDTMAAESAGAVNALAYTAGEDVVFAAGQYKPESEAGQKLLAHELTHVVQQDRHPSLVRRQLAPGLSISMTPQYAAALSDADLAQQISALQNHLSNLADKDPERPGVVENLEVLRNEQAKRGTPVDLANQAIGEEPRPAGLPMDQGYALYDAPDDLQALGDLLPEGQIVTVSGEGPENGPHPSRYTSPVAGAAGPTSSAVNAITTSQGFAAAGENSIIVVAIPRWGTPGAMVPESTSVWGHTAVGVRIDGKIQMVRGFSPADTGEVVANYSAVRSGSMAVTAEITDDIGLLTKTGAVTIEYPVARTVAQAFAQQLPPPGPIAAGGPGYTAVPATFGNACEGQNCVMWATQQAEQVLKGRIGPAGGTPITDVPLPGQAGQGPLVRFVRNVSQGAEDVAPVEGAVGPAVAGGMSTGFKVLKVGGRVMIVVSVLMVPLETYLAPPGQRERTFVGASAGLVGGIAGGAIAVSLVCGPGAPVCAIIAGIGGGLIGSTVLRGAAEDVYDALQELKDTPRFIRDVTWSPYGTPEARRAWCEEAEVEGVNDPYCDLFAIP
jgi:hypothetical protein